MGFEIYEKRDYRAQSHDGVHGVADCLLFAPGCLMFTFSYLNRCLMGSHLQLDLQPRVRIASCFDALNV